MITETDLSIVIAVWDETAGLECCLKALDRQRDHRTQIIVVLNILPPSKLTRRYHWVQWVNTESGVLIPHLWGIGMARATGRIVAITTAHFTPAPDYIAAIRAAHARLDAVGVGGRIDPPRGGSTVDWATYFLRYSLYLTWDREKNVTDIAGDNASYKRAALAAHPHFLREGFWEADFHRAVLAEKKTLRFVPAIRVTQQKSFGFRRFIRQRYRHGTQFGLARMRGRGYAVRLTWAMGLPLIPLVLLAKITRRVACNGHHLGPFIRCLPVLLTFLLGWSAGEVRGYLTRDDYSAPHLNEGRGNEVTVAGIQGGDQP